MRELKWEPECCCRCVLVKERPGEQESRSERLSVMRPGSQVSTVCGWQHNGDIMASAFLGNFGCHPVDGMYGGLRGPSDKAREARTDPNFGMMSFVKLNRACVMWPLTSTTAPHTRQQSTAVTGNPYSLDRPVLNSHHGNRLTACSSSTRMPHKFQKNASGAFYDQFRTKVSL